MSRTGTAQYFHWRKRVLTEAKNRGVTHCPFVIVFSTMSGRGFRILPSLITFFLSAGAVKIPLIMVA